MATLIERRKTNVRERKEVPRYSNTDFEKKIIEGEGQVLREIAEIKAAFKSCPRDVEFLKIVHKTLYGTDGQQDVRRKEILSFKGVKGENEEETIQILERRRKFLEKQTYAALIEMCRLFCLAGAAKEKTKEKYAEEIIKFIEKPGNTKPVVTPKDKIAEIAEPIEEVEEEKPKKKPVTKAKKTEKKGKAAAKKESKAKTAAKKDKKETPKKKATEKKETPKKKVAEKKETPKKPKATEKKEKTTPAKKETKKCAKK